MSSQGLGQGCSNKGYASWGLSVSILALDFPLHHELPIQGDFAPPPRGHATVLGDVFGSQLGVATGF